MLLGRKQNQQTFFIFFQFHNRRIQQISHWTMTARALPRTTHIRRYEKNIPIQRKRLEIMVSWKRSNNRTEEDCEEEENFFQTQRVLCFIFDPWCVMIYGSFRI